MNKLLVVFALTLTSSLIKAQTGVINKDTKGVLVYKYQRVKSNVVIIYKENGIVLRKLVVNDNLLNDYIIGPFALQGEYNLLVFDCIGITPDSYVVVANDKTGLIGYIKKSDSHFKFETWSQHIIHMAAVDFDVKSNPLHRLPDAKSPVIKFNSEEAYSPKAVKGNWLKVIWGYPKESSGWIRWWDDNHRLLVGVYYVM